MSDSVMNLPMRTSLAALLLSLLAAGCATGTATPAVSPAARQLDYATTYPSTLKQTSAGYEQDVTTVQRLKKDLKSYPEALEEPDWELAFEIYELADADGQNGHYAKTMEDSEIVARFFTEEKKELVSRTTSSVNYRAKEKGCDVQLYGSVDHGLERAVSDQLLERRERASDALRKLNELDVPKNDANVKTLKEQAMNITLLSHVVHVALPSRNAKLERLVSESSEVKRTLDEREKNLTEAEEPKSKQLAQERAAELEKIRAARSSLDEDIRTAETLLSLSEQQIEGLTESYEEEFDELLDLVRKAQGKSAKAPEESEGPADSAKPSD